MLRRLLLMWRHATLNLACLLLDPFVPPLSADDDTRHPSPAHTPLSLYLRIQLNDADFRLFTLKHFGDASYNEPRLQHQLRYYWRRRLAPSRRQVLRHIIYRYQTARVHTILLRVVVHYLFPFVALSTVLGGILSAWAISHPQQAQAQPRPPNPYTDFPGLGDLALGSTLLPRKPHEIPSPVHPHLLWLSPNTPRYSLSWLSEDPDGLTPPRLSDWVPLDQALQAAWKRSYDLRPYAYQQLRRQNCRFLHHDTKVIFPLVNAAVEALDTRYPHESTSDRSGSTSHWRLWYSSATKAAKRLLLPLPNEVPVVVSTALTALHELSNATESFLFDVNQEIEAMGILQLEIVDLHREIADMGREGTAIYAFRRQNCSLADATSSFSCRNQWSNSVEALVHLRAWTDFQELNLFVAQQRAKAMVNFTLAIERLLHTIQTPKASMSLVRENLTILSRMLNPRRSIFLIAVERAALLASKHWAARLSQRHDVPEHQPRNAASTAVFTTIATQPEAQHCLPLLECILPQRSSPSWQNVFWPLNLLRPLCARKLAAAAAATTTSTSSRPTLRSPADNTEADKFLSWLHNSIHNLPNYGGDSHQGDRLFTVPRLTYQPVRQDWTCTDYQSASWKEHDPATSPHDWLDYYGHMPPLGVKEYSAGGSGGTRRGEELLTHRKPLNDWSLKQWWLWKKGLNGKRCVGIEELKGKVGAAGGEIYCIDVPWEVDGAWARKDDDVCWV